MTNVIVRSLHDVGVPAWFGGSLMGALGLNGASHEVNDPTERADIAAAGWARWSPVAAAAIGSHVVGGVGLVVANSDRVFNQKGVTANTTVKALLTLAAIGATAYSGVLGAKLATSTPSETAGGTKPSATTPNGDATIQQQLRVLQWVTPVLTGTLIVLGAQQGEQQSTGEVLKGRARKALTRARLARLFHRQP